MIKFKSPASLFIVLFAFISVFFQLQVEAASNSDALPNAKAGQCFAKVKKPQTFKTQSRQVLLKKASYQRVLVRPAQYRTVNKKILVSKARKTNHYHPAKYKNVTKRVIVKPSYETWREGHGPITRIDHMTGKIMCRVKIPAVYQNKQVRVLVSPAKTTQKYIPAVYKTVKQKQQIAPALYKPVRTPALYKTQNYQVKASEARYEWKSILCKTNYKKPITKKVARKVATKASIKAQKQRKARIMKMQTALKDKGFDPGEIDGHIGTKTVAAINLFQKSRGLTVGQVTKDTSRALGLVR